MGDTLGQHALVYTLAEAAAALAVSQRAILRLGREGRVRILRLGDHTVRIPRSDIEALISGAPDGDR